MSPTQIFELSSQIGILAMSFSEFRPLVTLLDIFYTVRKLGGLPGRRAAILRKVAHFLRENSLLDDIYANKKIEGRGHAGTNTGCLPTRDDLTGLKAPPFNHGKLGTSWYSLRDDAPADCYPWVQLNASYFGPNCKRTQFAKWPEHCANHSDPSFGPMPDPQFILFHAFWIGDITPEFVNFFRAYALTQNLNKARLIFWYEGELDRIPQQVQAEAKALTPYVEVRKFLWDAEAKGTCMEDIVRILLLYKLGGVWVDYDVFFLRDWTSSVLSSGWEFIQGQGETTKKLRGAATWKPNNGAVVRLFRDSDTARCAMGFMANSHYQTHAHMDLWAHVVSRCRTGLMMVPAQLTAFEDCKKEYEPLLREGRILPVMRYQLSLKLKWNREITGSSLVAFKLYQAKWSALKLEVDSQGRYKHLPIEGSFVVNDQDVAAETPHAET
eukprot:g26930.t1